MLIHQLHIKNFRCFENFTLDFSSPIICIAGPNGSGKSSILEALHYACYLRSFRTHVPKELVQFDNENFFIKINISELINNNPLTHELHVGFSKKKRLVKINQQAISSYKELSRLYRVVTLIEDDLLLIKGGPETRRLFIDQALSLTIPEFVSYSKRYKQILENRNALLHKGNFSRDSYLLWTEQLWQAAKIIQSHRITWLAALQEQANCLIHNHFGKDLQLVFEYSYKKTMHDSFDAFVDDNANLEFIETMLKRSLFGAHLDDFCIEFCQKNSRSFASRGQQKLIIMLIKIAQLQEIGIKHGKSLFLLDDFMNDFDQKTAETLLSLLLKLDAQLIFTSPTDTSYFDQLLHDRQVQRVNLTP